MRVDRMLNIFSKLFLAGLLLHYLLNTGLSQYQNKGMQWRLIVYPLMAMLVSLIYWLPIYRSKRRPHYPHWSDFLITLAFAGDMLGNTLNLFDTVTWWDDLMHFVLWCLWVMAVAIILRMYTSLTGVTIAAVVIGVGAVGSILWELAEYSTFVTTNPNESLTAYRDTMGDELLSFLGSILAGMLVLIYSGTRGN